MGTPMKRIAIMVIGVLGSATTAFAQQSSTGVTKQAVVQTSPTAPSATTTSATTAPSTESQGEQTNNARPTPEMIKEARRDGYVLKTKANSGTYAFCKTDAKTGTRFTTESCVDVEKYALLQQQKERDKDYMRSTIGQLHCNDRGCT